MRHYRPAENPSAFRKLAAAMWHAPNDPHIFGILDLDLTEVLKFLEQYNKERGCKATITHVMTRTLAMTLAKHPEYNAKIGWSQIRVRNSVDIFCQVSTDGGRDLSGYKIQGVDKLSIAGIAAALTKAAGDIRADRDPAFKRSRNMLQTLPLWALRIILWFMNLLTNKLDLDLPKLGMPRDPFGSAMVTSVGMLGIDAGFAPFTPIARCPIIITVTRVKPRPWVVGDKVEPRPVLRLCGTFDHRVIDGYHAGVISGDIERLIAEPGLLLTDAEQPTAR
ncbi:MAG: 2-oxo acid dehydrogenase subunit E2 [Deltaproteobacteria bacterium]|nr:2-oxo acid dehydrogenase subunit E2 [Deltaproteobacteria bacterium]